MTFVCLSKSKKNNEFCVAGKVINSDGTVGGWIRPINQHGDINNHDCLYQDGSYAKPLEIIKIPLKKHLPKKFQVENHLIDESIYWVKKGDYNVAHESLMSLCDYPKALWSNNSQTSSGKNDQVSPEEATILNESLYFIYVGSIIFFTSRWNQEKLKVRAEFIYNNVTYNLKVTDLAWIEYFDDKDLGSYNKENTFLTVSLALETFGGFHYKLIAEII